MRLDHLVRETSSFLKPEFEANGIAFEVDLPADDMSIMGDHGALHQVLMNVLLNARNALEKVEPGRMRIVRIRAERERRTIRLLVEDSGPGIPENEREVIFKAFVSKQCGGTGVGLSLARKIMAGHHGGIRAGESELGGALIALDFPDPRASTLIPRVPLFRESLPPEQPETERR
jgi:signal transduction histidine kinase